MASTERGAVAAAPKARTMSGAQLTADVLAGANLDGASIINTLQMPLVRVTANAATAPRGYDSRPGRGAVFLLEGFDQLGLGAGDSTSPVVSNFTPALGSSILSTTPLGFDVTDNSGSFRRIVVGALFASLGLQEVVHDGVSFMPNYTGTCVGIANGFRYLVSRAGGWPLASPTTTVTFNVWAIDKGGNEAP